MTNGSHSSSYILNILLILAFLAIGPTSVLASDSLQFSGVISDSSGAVVPAATVTVVNLGTADTKSAQSDAKGWFEFLLPAGKYRIEITATGFDTFRRQGIEVSPTAPLRLDAVLRVEAQQESVEVTAVGTQMDLSSMQVGEGIG